MMLSRNKREGWYCWKWKGKFRRSKNYYHSLAYVGKWRLGDY